MAVYAHPSLADVRDALDSGDASRVQAMRDPQVAKANEAALTVLRSSDFQALANTPPIPGLAGPRSPAHIAGPAVHTQRGSAGEAVGHREILGESRTAHFYDAADRARQ